MRLFVAVDPPAPALHHLESALMDAGACKDASDLRWVPPAQWHITLAFLGEVGDERLAELSTRLARVAGRHQPLPIRITGAGAFGSVSRARVLWAGLRCDRPALRRLADSVKAAARRVGVPTPTGRFHPHLTLARPRQPCDLAACVSALAGYVGPAWSIDEMRLVRSRLGAGEANRPVHDTLGRWPLRGR